jgi:hypothetical protein
MAFTTVTVTGTVVYDNGVAVTAGSVSLTPGRPFTNGETTQSAAFTYNLTTSGAITGGTTLKALNDAGTHPNLAEGYEITTLVDGITRPAGFVYARKGHNINLGTITVPFPTTRKPVYGIVALTDAATIATNAAFGSYFRCAAVAGNRTVGAPTNPTDGQQGVWELTASGGSRTVTFDSGGAGKFIVTDIVDDLAIVIASGKTAIVEATYVLAAARWVVTNAAVVG